MSTTNLAYLQQDSCIDRAITYYYSFSLAPLSFLWVIVLVLVL